MPHSLTCQSLPDRGAACRLGRVNTPSWHHTEETTRMSALNAAKGTLSLAVCSAHSSGESERICEVHGEQAREEHQLAGEPDDGADRHHVGSGRRTGAQVHRARWCCRCGRHVRQLWGHIPASAAHRRLPDGSRWDGAASRRRFASIGAMTDSHGGPPTDLHRRRRGRAGPGPAPVPRSRCSCSATTAPPATPCASAWAVGRRATSRCPRGSSARPPPRSCRGRGRRVRRAHPRRRVVADRRPRAGRS